MKFFKSYTYTWWQVAIFKLALMSFGVVVGTYWHDFFRDNLIIFVILGIISGGYILYISLKNK